MSGNPEDEKEAQKALPLDLARTQITTVRTVESNKTPVMVTGQALRSVRVLTQGVSSNNNPSSVGQAIITNIVSQAVIKQDCNRTQVTGVIGSTQSQVQPQVSGSLPLQRPAQTTLSTTHSLITQTQNTPYHVPRGPAVVANLAAPRSNVTTVRTPMVVMAQNSQAHSFVRPSRTPSPAQGTAWLTTNSSNGSQIKGAPTVLSSPVRGATVTGKPQTIGRSQPTGSMPTIRSNTLLQNAITIGQSIHSFKPTPGSIQAIGNTVSLAQMMPSRTQAVVYNANTAAQFTPTARINVTETVQTRVPQPRPLGPVVTGARLSVPVSQIQAQTSRMMVPSQTVALASNTRVSAVISSTQPQPQPILATTPRIVTSQSSPNMVGRLSVAPSTVTGSVSCANNILTSQARISTLSTLNLQSLVAVANGGHARVQATQGPKVITQPAQATIHLAQLPSQIKTSASVVTTGARTLSVPASIITQQRANSVGPTAQAISIAKVFPGGELQGNPGTTSVFIHAPLQTPPSQRHASPSPGPVSSVPQQTVVSVPPTTVPSYSLTSGEGGAYFYESSSGAYQRTFIGQQPSAFVAHSTSSQQQQMSRPPVTVSSQQLHGMRFSSVVVVEPNRAQQQPQFQHVSSQSVAEPQFLIESSQQQLQQTQTKMTSSPRPSILRKRDHEGSPLKAAKNLMPVLQNLSQQILPQAPSSPPSSPTPDSRDNGHSSGSTTMSATSSPGIAEVNEDGDGDLLAPLNVKDEGDEEAKPPLEMSPRKKPRKQQLTGNEIDENHDDMQFISESGLLKKEDYDSDGQHSDSGPKDGAPEAIRITTLRKPASASLLNGYRQNWKATHNHYQRYSDVKPKDERRPTIMDLANQNRVQDKINGWKIYHLSTQMEDLAEQEQTVYNQLTELLRFTESEESTKQNDREVNRVNELIKGNLQRIKIINDGMLEAKCQIMKIFDHQRHINDIISRCASKRNFKKREKS